MGGGRAGRVACTVQPLVNNIIATLELKPADTGLKRGVNWCGVMLNLGWCSGGQMQLVGFPASALLSLQIIGSGGLWMGTVVVTYPLTVSETLKWLLSLPTFMQNHPGGGRVALLSIRSLPPPLGTRPGLRQCTHAPYVLPVLHEVTL